MNAQRKCCDRQSIVRMRKWPEVNDICLRCRTHWHGDELRGVKRYERWQWDALIDAAWEADRLFPQEGAEVELEFHDGTRQRATYRLRSFFSQGEIFFHRDVKAVHRLEYSNEPSAAAQ